MQQLLSKAENAHQKEKGPAVVTPVWPPSHSISTPYGLLPVTHCHAILWS